MSPFHAVPVLVLLERCFVHFNAETGGRGQTQKAIPNRLDLCADQFSPHTPILLCCGKRHVLDKEVRQARRKLYCDRGSDRPAFMIRRHGRVVGLGHCGNPTNHRDTRSLQIGTQNIDGAFSKQVLELARLRDVAPEAERRHTFVRDLLNRPQVCRGAGLVEPEQMEAFQAGCDAGGIAGAQPASSIQHEVEILRTRSQPIHARPHRTVERLPLVASIDGGNGNLKRSIRRFLCCAHRRLQFVVCGACQ